MDFVSSDMSLCVGPMRLEEFDDVPEPMPEVYIADSIRKTRWRKGQAQYLVKWKGWPSRFNTWEPEEHILDFQLIRIFEQKKLLKIQRTKVRTFASKSVNASPTRKKQFKKSRKPRKHDVNSRNKLVNIHPVDKTYAATNKFDHHVSNKVHPNRISIITPFREIQRTDSLPCPNRDVFLQSDNNCDSVIFSNQIHCDDHGVCDDFKVSPNIFHLLKYKRPPIHQQTQQQLKSKNDFICDTPSNLYLNAEEDNFKPPLDCLRSIKFKLGWHYAQMERTQGTHKESDTK